MNFTVYRSTGQIISSGQCIESDFFLQALAEPGCLLLEARSNPESQMIQDAEVVDLPPRPTQHHVFNWTAKQWIDPRTLQEIKGARWEEVKRARQAAEFGGFTWDGSTFDSDAISQSRLQGAVQLAGMAPNFNIDWTLQDNTVRALGAADMAAVGMALGQHVASQHARARELRVQIDAAATAADLAGIEWLERHEK